MLRKKNNPNTIINKKEYPFNIIELNNFINYLEKQFPNNITSVDYNIPEELYKRVGQIGIINHLKKIKREINPNAT